MEIEDIRPSPQARQLFCKMVNHSDDCNMAISQAFQLGLELGSAGLDPSASVEITELVSESWIRPDTEGGWLLR